MYTDLDVEKFLEMRNWEHSLNSCPVIFVNTLCTHNSANGVSAMAKVTPQTDSANDEIGLRKRLFASTNSDTICGKAGLSPRCFAIAAKKVQLRTTEQMHSQNDS
jgi:hypothetical protein